MAIEIFFNILAGLAIAFYLFKAMQFRDIENGIDVFGAGGFPQIIGFLGLIVLIVITIRTLKEKHQVNIPLFDMTLPGSRILLANILLLAAYIALLNVLGFAVSTILYLFIAPASFGYDKWVLLTVFSLLSASILVGVFGTVFYVPLPRGIGIFRELSYLVY